MHILCQLRQGLRCRLVAVVVAACKCDAQVLCMNCRFPNIGIQCVKKGAAKESLQKRKELRVDPFCSMYFIFYAYIVLIEARNVFYFLCHVFQPAMW